MLDSRWCKQLSRCGKTVRNLSLAAAIGSMSMGCGLIDLAKDAVSNVQNSIADLTAFNGYVATGKAIDGATVRLVCGGSVAAQVTTDAAGFWTARIDIFSIRLPCTVEASYVDNTGTPRTLRSVIDSARSTTVHTNPMTEVVVAQIETSGGGVANLGEGAFLAAGRAFMRTHVGGGLDFSAVATDPNFVPRTGTSNQASLGDVVLDALSGRLGGNDYSVILTIEVEIADDPVFAGHMGAALLTAETEDNLADFFLGTTATAFQTMQSSYQGLFDSMQTEYGDTFAGFDDARFQAGTNAMHEFIGNVAGGVDYGEDFRQATNVAANAINIIDNQLVNLLRNTDATANSDLIRQVAGGALGQAADAFRGAFQNPGGGLDLTGGLLDQSGLDAFNPFLDQVGSTFDAYGSFIQQNNDYFHPGQVPGGDPFAGGGAPGDPNFDFQNELSNLGTQFGLGQTGIDTLSMLGGTLGSGVFNDPFAGIQTDFCWGICTGAAFDACCSKPENANDGVCLGTTDRGCGGGPGAGTAGDATNSNCKDPATGQALPDVDPATGTPLPGSPLEQCCNFWGPTDPLCIDPNDVCAPGDTSFHCTNDISNVVCPAGDPRPECNCDKPEFAFILECDCHLPENQSKDHCDCTDPANAASAYCMAAGAPPGGGGGGTTGGACTDSAGHTLPPECCDANGTPITPPPATCGTAGGGTGGGGGVTCQDGAGNALDAMCCDAQGVLLANPPAGYNCPAGGGGAGGGTGGGGGNATCTDGAGNTIDAACCDPQGNLLNPPPAGANCGGTSGGGSGGGGNTPHDPNTCAPLSPQSDDQKNCCLGSTDPTGCCQNYFGNPDCTVGGGAGGGGSGGGCHLSYPGHCCDGQDNLIAGHPDPICGGGGGGSGGGGNCSMYPHCCPSGTYMHNPAMGCP